VKFRISLVLWATFLLEAYVCLDDFPPFPDFLLRLFGNGYSPCMKMGDRRIYSQIFPALQIECAIEQIVKAFRRERVENFGDAGNFPSYELHIGGFTNLVPAPTVPSE